MSQIIFQQPWWFLLVVALGPILWSRGRHGPTVVIPFSGSWHRPALSVRSRLAAMLLVGSLLLLIACMTRPQRIEQKRQIQTKGYDIMLAIDLSESMLAEDYEQNGAPINRLQAIKPIMQSFIAKRPNDRIGLVVFSGRAYTFAPLTSNHAWLGAQTGKLSTGLLENGTAIGDGLAVALARLSQPSRGNAGNRQGAFVVLLTDGASNEGFISPAHAAELGRERGITVFTIGAGRKGLVPFPVFNAEGKRTGSRQFVSDLDEPTLRAIAQRTGGAYFRANDVGAAEAAFAAIDRTKKIEFESKSFQVTTELFPWLAMPGLGFLFLSVGSLEFARRKNA